MLTAGRPLGRPRTHWPCPHLALYPQATYPPSRRDPQRGPLEVHWSAAPPSIAGIVDGRRFIGPPLAVFARTAAMATEFASSTFAEVDLVSTTFWRDRPNSGHVNGCTAADSGPLGVLGHLGRRNESRRTSVRPRFRTKSRRCRATLGDPPQSGRLPDAVPFGQTWVATIWARHAVEIVSCGPSSGPRLAPDSANTSAISVDWSPVSAKSGFASTDTVGRTRPVLGRFRGRNRHDQIWHGIDQLETM